MLNDLWLRVRALFRRKTVEAELDDELRFHLQSQIEKYVQAGITPAEAKRRAQIELGGMEQVKEECRDARGTNFFEDTWRDVRYGARMLRKSPGFTVVAILTLALGIGASTAIFSIVDSALIRGLPYPGLSRLVGVFKTTELGNEYAGYSYPDFLDLEHSNRVFASVAAAYADNGFVLSDSAGRHLVTGTSVTADYFRVLGVKPFLGRDFAAQPDAEDLQATPSTAILSYAAWRKWFDGKPDALGKTVTLDGKPYTVIGVLPRSFFAPGGVADIWTTLHDHAGDPCFSSRGCMAMDVIARLKNGVTLQQALANLRAIAAREAQEHPDPDAKRGANIAPLGQRILGDVEPILLALLAGVGLLLLIAYGNVAGLLFVRSENRRREFALRGALGASRGRLTRQFISEGFVVVAASAAMGLAAATFARRLLFAFIPTDILDSMPYLRGGWNWHVALFATALAAVALILFVATPSLRLPGANLRTGLAEGSSISSARGDRRRVGAKLVVLELAATTVLLVGAGLLGESLYKLLHVNLGFVPNNLATLMVGTPESRYSTAAEKIALHREIIGRLEMLPGVIAAGSVRDLPMRGPASTQIGFVGRPSLGVENEVGHQAASAGYLSAVVKAQLLRGRYFSENDSASAPLVGIINQTLARRYFPGANPIGKQFFYHAHDVTRESSQPHIRIVGVIADMKEYGLAAKAKPVIYTPYEQWAAHYSVVVRTSQSAASVLPSLIATIHKIDPQILTADPETMNEIIQGSWAAYLHRALASLAGCFAALALLLSAIGLYGVIAYSLSRRTREIGMRMALGAQRGEVLRMVIREGMLLAGVGVAIGAGAALALTRLLRSFLFEISPTDPATFAGVAVALTLVVLLACYIPARRAMRVDPATALRHE